MTTQTRRPAHIQPGSPLAKVWDSLYERAQNNGGTTIVVTDNPSPEELKALAAVGGAVVMPNQQGTTNVQLNFDQTDTDEERAIRAAAKRHTFA